MSNSVPFSVGARHRSPGGNGLIVGVSVEAEQSSHEIQFASKNKKTDQLAGLLLHNRRDTAELNELQNYRALPCLRPRGAPPKTLAAERGSTATTTPEWAA